MTEEDQANVIKMAMEIGLARMANEPYEFVDTALKTLNIDHISDAVYTVIVSDFIHYVSYDLWETAEKWNKHIFGIDEGGFVRRLEHIKAEQEDPRYQEMLRLERIEDEQED